jgi:DNA-binding transcriptional regulator YhcF (GntR family)
MISPKALSVRSLGTHGIEKAMPLEKAYGGIVEKGFIDIRKRIAANKSGKEKEGSYQKRKRRCKGNCSAPAGLVTSVNRLRLPK